MTRATSFPLHKIKAVLCEGVHQGAADLLTDAGYTVEHLPRALNPDELLAAAQDAHLLGIRSRTAVNPNFLTQASRLLAIGCFCIGADQVDLSAAASNGVAVFNAPFSNTRSVAEMTIAQIIALNRRLFERSAQLHAGKWDKSAAGSHEVRGKTLGVIGYGRIGSQLSILAEAMGMRVLYYDMVKCLPIGNAQQVDSLDDLLTRADALSLHVPATSHTEQMLGANQLTRMKPGSLLINNSRGAVVDLDALAQAIRSGHIAGAALDVFPVEPQSADQPFSCPLSGLPNVILTPHIGGSTEQAQEAIADEVATKLIKLTNNGSTTTALNIPEVELPILHEDNQRILHYHHNVPGVLSKLHQVIADRGVNISAEYLQSDPRHGYVILDVERSQAQAIADAFREIPETIRVRTLW